MIEKCSPAHPDKIADRIAGACVDKIVSVDANARAAVEVMIGHNYCLVIIESNVQLTDDDVRPIVKRISGLKEFELKLISVPQDEHLSKNQEGQVRCGDNGIFKCNPLTREEIELGEITRYIYDKYPNYDGKYILDEDTSTLIVCQSNVGNEFKRDLEFKYPQYNIIFNPLGYWEGGVNCDTGLTGRKIGDNLGSSISGGALTGKDCSKCDVSAQIYFWLEAQRTGKPQHTFAAIGDTEINGVPYQHIVDVARDYIDKIGGYEELAKFGLV